MPAERPLVAVAMSTYNDADRAIVAINSVLASEGNVDVVLTVVDDGSEPELWARMAASQSPRPALVMERREHRERGVARCEAIQLALDRNPDFLLFLDADMRLAPGAISACLDRVAETGAGAVVIQEVPFSEHRNFATRVKVFERAVVNDSRRPIGSDSIEAARFWTVAAYRASGGLRQEQTAFEEIQPTIRFRRAGGVVVRLAGEWLWHDEKHVRMRELLSKKAGYFFAMEGTTAQESSGVWEAIRRWYPFRGVYYERQNLHRYRAHPELAAGMAAMYGALTASAAVQWGRARWRRTADQGAVNP